MSVDEQGNIIDEEAAAPEVDAPGAENVEPEPTQPEPSGDDEDALFKAAMQDVHGPSEEEAEEQPDEAEGEPGAEAAAAEPKKVRFDEEAFLVDEDGREHSVKDVLWRTQQYHRKMQELHDQHKERLSTLDELDKRFKADPVGLAMQVLEAREPGLAKAFKTVLAQAQAQGQYDPQAPRRRMLEIERQEFEQQRQQFEAQRLAAEVQARIRTEREQVEARLGRPISADEDKAMQAALQRWKAARAVNPEEPLPTFQQLYDLATRAIEWKKLTTGTVPKAAKQPTKAARPAAAPRKAMPVSDDELFVRAMKEAGLEHLAQ